MLTRFESFAEEYEVMLEEMTPEQFANLKSGVLTQLTEPPTNLADEAGPFIGDWNRENYAFSTRDTMIEAVKKVSLQSVRDYYRDTVLSEAPSRILIQMRGERWQAEPFADIEDAIVLESVEAFHRDMPVQPLN
jgi:protease-3